MNSIIQYKEIAGCQLKDVDKKSRLMIGAFTRYDVLDSDGDIGKKGMFSKTWTENFARIKHLLNHDVTKPVGKIKRLWDDDQFAYYESAVGTHKLGDDVLDMAESGLITEHSYGYNTVRQNKAKEGNELIEVKQWELSNLTGWGANQHSPLLSFSKASDKINLIQRLNDRVKSLERFCNNSTASDETIELLLLEIKQLHQQMIDIVGNSTPAAVEAPEPQNQLIDLKAEAIDTDAVLAYLSLKKQLITV